MYLRRIVMSKIRTSKEYVGPMRDVVDIVKVADGPLHLTTVFLSCGHHGNAHEDDTRVRCSECKVQGRP